MGIVRIPAITSTREWPLAESAWPYKLGIQRTTLLRFHLIVVFSDKDPGVDFTKG